jgi:hypothetical protein
VNAKAAANRMNVSCRLLQRAYNYQLTQTNRFRVPFASNVSDFTARPKVSGWFPNADIPVSIATADMKFATPCRTAVLLAVAGTCANAATIVNIVAGPTLSGNAAALAAFNRAATTWESVLADPVTVTINADLNGALGPGVIGSTNPVGLAGGYSVIRNAMVADAQNEVDDLIATQLPTAAQYSALMNSGFSLSGNLSATKANLKALGFGTLDGSFGLSDGTITFSSTFSFDYDNSNGVTAGQMDFETVALHEIGHLLGFMSSVDEIDFNISTPHAISPTTLDMFRFSTVPPGVTAATFSTAARSLVAGGSAQFFDGTNYYLMSTGVNNGDGRQASHWKDNLGLGAMDPTLAFGEIANLTAADLRAMDLIGWEINSVPEPGTWAMMVGGLGVIAWTRRRRDA